MKKNKKRVYGLQSHLEYINAKKVIPKGFYCYTMKESLPDGLGYYIDVCPYYEYPKTGEFIIGYCNLNKKEPYEIWDQCKSCGINKNFKF